MLSLRMILTVAAAGIALWSLFALLDTLGEPGLLRSVDRAVVKGCETLESEEAQQLCPPLLCQAALFNAKHFSQQSILHVAEDETRDAERLIVVTASESPGAPAQEFVCVMRREQVLLSRPAQPAEIRDALASDEGWSKRLSATMAP